MPDEDYEFTDTGNDTMYISRGTNIGVVEHIVIEASNVWLPNAEVPAMCAAALRAAGLPVPAELLPPPKTLPTNRGATVQRAKDGLRGMRVTDIGSTPWVVPSGAGWNWLTIRDMVDWAGDDWTELHIPEKSHPA